MIELLFFLLKAFLVFLLVIAVVGMIARGFGALFNVVGKALAHYKAMIANPHDIGELIVGGTLWLVFFGMLGGTIFFAVQA